MFKHRIDNVSTYRGISRLLSGRWLPLLTFLAIQAGPSFAQSPPFVVTGPQISLRPGCTLKPTESLPGILTTSCVSISYASDSPIAQSRYMMVPRGNLEFDLPVSSTVAKPVKGGLDIEFSVNMTVTGPNPGENISQLTTAVGFMNAGQATLRIPVNVDWAESLVSFQIAITEQWCLRGTQKNGEPNCTYGQGSFSGPDLSAATNGGNWIGAEWPNLTPDAFLVVATPAAAFQLSIIPTTIVYGPLGNGPNAASSYGVTEITASNQQFTDTQDQTHGLINDDKTQYQYGVTLSLSGKGDSKDKIAAGYTDSQSWDDSTETDSQNSYATSQSVAFETQSNATFTVIPTPGQPSLDKVSSDTQPFWSDVILGVANPQYALWDYPAGPVIQALGGASLVFMPIRQLDHCAKAPAAIEPVALTPVQWTPSSVFAQGSVILDANNNIQVVTSSGGVSGSAAPAWNSTKRGTTTDGSITWTNEQTDFVIYRGSVPQNTVDYLQVGPWQPNQVYPLGAVLLGPASIEVATTAGISGTSAPNWNRADESTTPDGTVIWTNEQDHLVVSAGPAASHQSAFQWLTSDNCNDYLSLDQFYVSQAQSATPIAYDVLGSMLSLAPTNEYTYSTQNKTTSSGGVTNSSKLTTITTAVRSNSNSLSGTVDYGLDLLGGVLGIELTGSRTGTSTATSTWTTVDSQALQSATTTTGQTMASTTIQDMGSEPSIPVNILLDSIFMGIAVQDTNLQPALTKAAARTASFQEALPAKYRGLPVVATGHSSMSLQEEGSPEPTDYVQQTNYGFAIAVSKPRSTPEIEQRLREHHVAGAHQHEQRGIPAPPPPSTKY